MSACLSGPVFESISDKDWSQRENIALEWHDNIIFRIKRLKVHVALYGNPSKIYGASLVTMPYGIAQC